MRKHSAQTTGLMIEVFEGRTHTDTVMLPSFCAMADWFDEEVRNVIDPTLVPLLKAQIAKGSPYWAIGTTDGPKDFVVLADTVKYHIQSF